MGDSYQKRGSFARRMLGFSGQGQMLHPNNAPPGQATASSGLRLILAQLLFSLQ